jgi:vacuolar-type H+-ATPase subunit H
MTYIIMERVFLRRGHSRRQEDAQKDVKDALKDAQKDVKDVLKDAQKDVQERLLNH